MENVDSNCFNNNNNNNYVYRKPIIKKPKQKITNSYNNKNNKLTLYKPIKLYYSTFNNLADHYLATKSKGKN